MPIFGALAGQLPEVGIQRSQLGKIIAKNIALFPNLSPRLQIMQYIIMPDHVHLLLRVTDTLEYHLGNYIGMFKVRTGKDYEALTGVKAPVFEEDFYDCILYPGRDLNSVFKYIKDNPRRLAERRTHPDFFRRVNNLIIDGKHCQAYGNMQLLNNPFKDQVVVHRAESTQQRQINRQHWLYTASNGGILVSPFISAEEKKIRDDAESQNGRFILITTEHFGERYKPSAHNFDLCTAGRLLIISAAPALGTTATSALSRGHCLTLNSLAAALCNH